MFSFKEITVFAMVPHNSYFATLQLYFLGFSSNYIQNYIAALYTWTQDYNLFFEFFCWPTKLYGKTIS